MKEEQDPSAGWDGSEPLGERWALLLLRLTQVLLLAWVGMEVPFPTIERGLSLQGPLVSLVCVILIGKAVYDTLFYDRYRP